jgi:hypothetical protein
MVLGSCTGVSCVETEAQGVQEVMAGLVILELMVKPGFLRPWWRLWSFPAPDPFSAGAGLF